MLPIAAVTTDTTALSTLCDDFVLLEHDTSIGRLWAILERVFKAKAQRESVDCLAAMQELEAVLRIYPQNASTTHDLDFALHMLASCSQSSLPVEAATPTRIWSLFASNKTRLNPQLTKLWIMTREVFEQVQYGPNYLFKALCDLSSYLQESVGLDMDVTCYEVLYELLFCPPLKVSMQSEIAPERIKSYLHGLFGFFLQTGKDHKLLDLVFKEESWANADLWLIEFLQSSVDNSTHSKIVQEILQKAFAKCSIVSFIKQLLQRTLSDRFSQQLLQFMEDFSKSPSTVTTRELYSINLRMKQFLAVDPLISGLRCKLACMRLAFFCETTLVRMKKIAGRELNGGEYFKKKDNKLIRSVVIDPEVGIFWLSKTKVDLLDIKCTYKRVTTAIFASLDPTVLPIVSAQSVNLNIRQQLGFDLARREVAIVNCLAGVPGLVQLQTFAQYSRELPGGKALDKLAIFWEYCEGDFQMLLQHGKVFTHQDQLSIAHDVLLALMGMHNAGYVHSDIKPNNILWKMAHGKMKVLLADFGLTFHIRELEQSSSFSLNGLYGSLLFTAPELLLGTEQNDPFMAEMWALGLFLYLLCFKKYPKWVEQVKECLTKPPMKNHKQLGECIVAELATFVPNDDPYSTLIYTLLHATPAKRLTSRRAYAEICAIKG